MTSPEIKDLFVFRLAILTIIISGAFTLSTSIYGLAYYFLIPTNIQEAPLHFKLQKFDIADNTPNTADSPPKRDFLRQAALYSHIEIESALSEFQRKATAPNVVEESNEIVNPEDFSSLNGPYTYEKGQLHQQNVPAETNVKTTDEHSQYIRMDGEFYEVDVVFDVAMSMQNYERGNLYLQSEFHSYK